MTQGTPAQAKAIQRQTGPTFYLATRLFPERVRHPTYVLYAFFRVADEVVDDPGDDGPAAQRAALRDLRRTVLHGEPTDDPVIEAFAEVRKRHGIPDSEVDAFLTAMESDVDTDEYPTRLALDDYMRGSAAAVGNMMTHVMGTENPEAATPHAEALGNAFQLTNFLRDVREDVEELDRVYLPASTLASHGLTPDDVRELEDTPALRRAVRDELRRAESLYREGVAGIHLLPEDCQFPVLLAAVMYAEYHRGIRRRNFDVVSDPPTLSLARKLTLLARLRVAWWRHPDPASAFYAVSAVPRAADDHETARSGSWVRRTLGSVAAHVGGVRGDE